LDALEARLEGGGVHEKFDLVCGTSIGGAGALFMAHLDDPLDEARQATRQMREACFVGASSWRLLVRGRMAKRGAADVVSGRVGESRPLRAPEPPEPRRPASTDAALYELGFASASFGDVKRAAVAARRALSDSAREPEAPRSRRPFAFAVAARETEGGALEPFLFRTYDAPRAALAAGRSDVKLWEAVSSTCAAPAYFAVSESIPGRRPARDIFELLRLAQIELVFHDS